MKQIQRWKSTLSINPRWGLFQLAFTVEDLEATVAELQAKGVELDYLLPEQDLRKLSKEAIYFTQKGVILVI